LTSEGIVIHTRDKPLKVKIRPEADVYIREIFRGDGKYKDSAGGFYYSLTPDGPIVGKVGTGLSDELRKDMFENPKEYIGRVARIAHQGQFASGSYRAPSLIALHEDYPTKDQRTNV
jgi:ATP-dependent DNA ligase